MTILVLILGGWPSLLCTIAAVLISFNCELYRAIIALQKCLLCFIRQRNEERRGNIASARTKGNISLGLNVAAVVFTIVVWSVVAIPVAVTVSAKSSATSPYTTPYTTPSPYCYTSPSSPYFCYTYTCDINYYSYYSYRTCSYSSYYSYYDESTNYYNYYTYYSAYCYMDTTTSTAIHMADINI